MRAKLIWALLAVVLALTAWALMTPSADPGRVGVNRLVENVVTTTPAGQTDWRPSILGADVNFGDRVATAAASRLEVSLLDRSLLTVGANAELAIDRFVYDPERNVAGVAVSMLRGAFRFASDNRGRQPEPIAFRTPGAAIGIRGTRIEGVVGPEAVAFLAGVPGAPDLSAEADSAAVIILREGAIGVSVNGQSVVLDRPVQMIALTRTRLYPPFGASAETDRRFEVLLPTRPEPVSPPPALSPPVDPAKVASVPAGRATPPAAADPDVKPRTSEPPIVREPPAREPPTVEPVSRPPAVRPPPTAVTTPPGTSAPATAAPTTSAPTTRDPPVRTTPPLRQPLTATPPPTRTAPVGTEPRQSIQPPPTRAPQP